MSETALVSTFLMHICGFAAADLAKDVVRAAERYDLEPRLIASLIRQESHCDPDAVGKLGELGLGQLKRNTLATIGFDHLTDSQLKAPALNLLLTARHLRRCLRKCGNSIAGALSLYKGIARDKKTKQCRDSQYAVAILGRLAES